nr:HAD family phosphatase [Maliibacterium massiliense]
MIQGAIFDLDGTLLDSLGLWLTLPYDLLARQGVCCSDPHLVQELSSMSLREAVATVKERFGLAADVETLMAQCTDIIRRGYEEKVELMPGVRAFLTALACKGVPMCVATASDRRQADAALRRLGVRRYFSFVLTDEDVGASKRQPAIYLEAARRMGVQPEACLVFEDAPHAIKTAQEAGFRVCAMGKETHGLPCALHMTSFEEGLEAVYV